MDIGLFFQNAVAPFQYEFMLKATLVSALTGIICAVLSCFVILKGWSLMGDAVSHSVLPGVVIAYVLKIPFAIGAFVFGLISVISIGFIKSRTRIKEDTVIGVVFTGLFALGLVLISKVSSDVHLSHILFGDVLGISDADVWQTVIVGGITLLAVLAMRKDLLLFCFDPTHARSIGLNTTFLYYALLVVLALTIVTALQTVGIILVVAMLVTPGATAYLMSDKFDRMLVIAVSSSVISGVVGTYVSYYLDGATGGCIVVLQTLLFLAAFVFAPKHGVLAKQRERRLHYDQAQLETSAKLETT
jgi:manganese transport system permease protein